MGNSKKTDALFISFQKPDTAEWLQTAAAEIDGKNPLESLAWSVKGLSGKLFYTADDAVRSFALPPDKQLYSGARSWVNLPVVTVKDENTANLVALDHLKNGADGVLFDLRKNTLPDIKKLLNGIEWPYCSLAFRLTNDAVVPGLLSYVSEKKWDTHSLNGFLLWGNVSEKNNLVNTFNTFHKVAPISFISKTKQDVADELADLLSQAVDYIEKQNSISESIFTRVVFSIEADSDFFITIAKLKALRWLWQNIAHAWGDKNYSPELLHIHATIPVWANDAFNPHSNMLHATTAALAAICGGCNSLTVQAEDEFNPMMSRIARNVSNILREESHLDKVADPTAGSYYVDTLVNQLAEQTWKKFSERY